MPLRDSVTARVPHGSRLQMERLALAAALARCAQVDAPLGAIGYGTEADLGWLATVDAALLPPAQAAVDVWHTDAPMASGVTGSAHWRSDGRWTFGAIDLLETPGTGALESMAQQAYRDLFRALSEAGTPHLLRIWNYLPGINADGGGLERYRQFNRGRQDAFLAAGRAAFDGAPAACALGIRPGAALALRFLAGTEAPISIENPRQVSAYRYPADYGPRAPTFSRAALAALGGGQQALFVSGTASIVGHESVHVGDVTAQAHETLRNLAAVVDAANARGMGHFEVAWLDVVVYVRHPADAKAVRAVIESTLGADSHFVRRAVFLQADVCRSDLLVEIEAHALAPQP